MPADSEQQGVITPGQAMQLVRRVYTLVLPFPRVPFRSAQPQSRSQTPVRRGSDHSLHPFRGLFLSLVVFLLTSCLLACAFFRTTKTRSKIKHGSVPSRFLVCNMPSYCRSARTLAPSSWRTHHARARHYSHEPLGDFRYAMPCYSP